MQRGATLARDAHPLLHAAADRRPWLQAALPARRRGEGLRGVARGAPRFSVNVVQLADLRVESPQIVEQAEQEQAARHQVDEAGEPLAHVEAMDAEDAEEGEQDPGDVVADSTRRVPQLSGALHPRDEKQVDQPADAEQPEREEPDRARDRTAEIEPVRSGEAENPQEIADQLAVRVVHLPMVRRSSSPENVAPSIATKRCASVTDRSKAMRRASRATRPATSSRSKA